MPQIFPNIIKYLQIQEAREPEVGYPGDSQSNH